MKKAKPGTVYITPETIKALDEWVGLASCRAVADEIGVAERTITYILTGRAVRRTTAKVVTDAVMGRSA